MQFFRTYNTENAAKSLTNTAAKIAMLLEENEDNLPYGLEIACELLDNETEAIIFIGEDQVYYSNEYDKGRFDLSYFRKDPELARVFTDDATIQKEIVLSDDDVPKDQILMIGVPLKNDADSKNAVFIYQSLDVMKETMKATSRIIMWSALIAFILTTVFAFFLTTRITEPLLRMKESRRGGEREFM